MQNLDLPSFNLLGDFLKHGHHEARPQDQRGSSIEGAWSWSRRCSIRRSCSSQSAAQAGLDPLDYRHGHLLLKLLGQVRYIFIACEAQLMTAGA
jgi:hypothetical protein